MQELTHLISSNIYLIADTLLVAVAMYYVLLNVRGTKTAVLLQALVLIGTLYFLCQHFKLITMAFLLERLLLIGPIAVLVVFAPEIRALLERASKRSHFIELLLPQQSSIDTEQDLPEPTYIDFVVDAVESLAAQRTGALIAVERSDVLSEAQIVPGTRLDAVPSVRLLTSIFEDGNPLHDGAVLIRDNRIHSAGNFLPNSENTLLPAELGTRHRAAIGLTEHTDAVVVVVSKERGEISLAFHGRLARYLTLPQFHEQLRALLDPNENFVTPVPRAAAA